MIDSIGSLSERIRGKKAKFLLVIGTTDVSLIPGITVAGATPELTMFTPAADAEYLITGKCKVINGVPITPDGIPTPALLTRASLSFMNIDKLVVNAGARVTPRIPYLDLHGEPGQDIRNGGIRKEVGERIIENGITLGESLSDEGILVIGESIPAGTTTAAAVLTGLGFDGIKTVSSSSPNNPKDIKRAIVEEAIRKSPSNLMDRIFWLSDPVLLGVSAVTIGFKGLVILAGGTQMTAVAAIVKELEPRRLSEIGIVTTRWVVRDSSASIVEASKEIGVNLSYSNVNLSGSQYEGLRVYERGFVKEGVGAGGSMALALSNGSSEGELVKRIDEYYSDLINADNKAI
ncbi:nicotinate mononucleotide-dependent phosphoribosyltransferase CobT [Metallosphaera hakonensis]|uniref:nicotinate mononucleotide-dependent phosphoribosyltransferase CobT n=1 Tax=Metallosphaera hakonensis TaxID=79601 RepID=UPI0006D1BE50|nr:TIGR00303 family protein [Metallosphaera hakonensis]